MYVIINILIRDFKFGLSSIKTLSFHVLNVSDISTVLINLWRLILEYNDKSLSSM